MRENPVKRRLAAGETVVGHMVFEFNTTGIARIAAAAGAEFIIFDMEHTGWSMETIRMLVAATRAENIVPMARVPATEYHFIARALDVGVMGVKLPMVQSAEQARRIVECAKYPPLGQRGAAFGVSHDDYSAGSVVEKMRSANEEGLIIAQIETAPGLENVEAIAAVEGVDVLWIGNFDLTVSMGIAGQFDHPDYLAAVKRVIAAGAAHGKAVGFVANTIADARWTVAEGFRMIGYGGDLWIFGNALREGINTIRAAVEAGEGRRD